jgi:hypothetical protein
MFGLSHLHSLHAVVRPGGELHGTSALGSDLADDSAEIARREHPCRNVPRHHSARPDHRPRPDPDARAEDRAPAPSILSCSLRIGSPEH